MTWKNILKIDIRNVKDAKRVARDYAPKDLVESYVVSQEEYDNMSYRDRQKYHRKIYNEYKAIGLQKTPEARWHIRNAARFDNVDTAIQKPHPTEEDLNPKEKYRSVLEGTGRRVFGPRKLSTARVVEGFKFGRKPSGRPKGAKDKKKRKSRGLPKRKPKPKPMPKPEIKFKPINQIIIDYFTMYNNRFGRNPTLQEIQEDERRPLTVDEIDSFERYAQSR